jgi:hypothetical protein
VRYARRGERRWYDGWTIDASVAGVRFLTTGPATAVDTPVELVIALPGHGPGDGARVLCAGHIARASEDASGPGRWLAVVIDEYELAPTDLATLPA